MANVYAIDGIVPVIDPTAFVHPSAVLIGDVIIGPGCYVGPGASLRGDFSRLILEEGSNLQDNCIVHGFPGTDTVIEVDGHIGHGAVLHGCIVRRNAMVGMNAVVMDGAIVGASAFVAAMAFVKAGFEVPSQTLVAGIPARVVRRLGERDLAWKREATAEYQALARRCLASLVEATPLAAPEPQRRRIAASTATPLHVQKQG
jgi:phenylacetic acid degradation protein